MADSKTQIINRIQNFIKQGEAILGEIYTQKRNVLLTSDQANLLNLYTHSSGKYYMMIDEPYLKYEKIKVSYSQRKDKFIEGETLKIVEIPKSIAEKFNNDSKVTGVFFKKITTKKAEAKTESKKENKAA